MISGVRVALFCDQVVDEGGSVSAVGLWDYILRAGNRPGAVEAVLLLQVELKPSPTRGFVRVEIAPEFDEVFPFDIATDAPLTAMMLPLLMPALGERHVRVSIVDEAVAAPWTFAWSLAFAPGAEPLDATAEEIVNSCRHAAAELRSTLTGPGALKPQ